MEARSGGEKWTGGMEITGVMDPWAGGVEAREEGGRADELTEEGRSGRVEEWKRGGL